MTWRIRQALERRRRRREHLARRDRREEALEDANVRAGELRELTELVDRITEDDPELAARLDLESLLDHVVQLLIARSRWSRVPGAGFGISRVHARRVALSIRAYERTRAFDLELVMIRELLEGLVLRCTHHDSGARAEWRSLVFGARSRDDDRT